ncbi:MAG: IS1 family transposase [Chloroflexota bacterium]|nr:IS1 family transposase [Chloroflexota bacterium]
MVNRLSTDKRAAVLNCLVEGMSMRSTSRILGVNMHTIKRLLVLGGIATQDYHDTHVRDLTPAFVQCDELWSFVYSHERRLPLAKAAPPGAGNVWTWVAFDSESKMMLCWLAGSRELDTAIPFFWDLRRRLKPGHRFQLSTDRYRAYGKAVREVFGNELDYGQLLKSYREVRVASGGKMQVVEAIRERAVGGQPETARISTSHVERQNLNIRMGLRRYTRKTNGFSKKLSRHRAALSLFAAYYNFCRIHLALDTTPAVAAGVAPEPYPVRWLAELVASIEAPHPPRGPDKRPRKRRRTSR